MDYIDYTDWVAKRITQLRNEKGVSARDMSISLGQSASYINKIENKRTLPSLPGLFFICDYFGISPKDFFTIDIASPQKVQEISIEAAKLTTEEAEHLLYLIQDLNKYK